MSDVERFLDAPITPLPDDVITAAEGCIMARCPADDVPHILTMLGLR